MLEPQFIAVRVGIRSLVVVELLAPPDVMCLTPEEYAGDHSECERIFANVDDVYVVTARPHV